MANPSPIRTRVPAGKRVNIHLPADLWEQLEKARADGHDINVSATAQIALRKLLRSLGY